MVMMEEGRKDKPTLVSEPAAIYYDTSQANPLAVLDQLGDLVKATGKTSEQFIGEHLVEKWKS